MARKFAELTFTNSVKAAQERYGSRSANGAFEQAKNPRDTLTRAEIAFIRAQDGFFQATVSESGWPYVQFRGGPQGFLKVLDSRTIAYADFRGNAQYLSVGNLFNDDRVALILVDYARRLRLKIWARARIVDGADDPRLLRRLADPDYPARIERAVVMFVEALDWNCPQHITPRFTTAEIRRGLEPRNESLPARGAANHDDLLGSCAHGQSLESEPGPRVPPRLSLPNQSSNGVA